jgi:hypothetical protein
VDRRGNALHGQICLALNSILVSEYVLLSPGRPKVEFWIMPRLGELDCKNRRRLNWELRYTFYVDVDHGQAAASPNAWGRGQYEDQPRAVWLDDRRRAAVLHAR